MRREDKNAKKCKNYIYRLLKFRNRSENEIREKLCRKKYPSQLREEIIEHFKRLGYIDDEKFAQEWIRFRLKVPFGLKRIKYELRQKGIEEDIIFQAFEATCQAKREPEILKQLAFKKMQIVKRSETDKLKAKRKLYQFLLRRGFSSGDIMETISQL